MRGINTVCLSGNLTRDAELRFTAGGTGICSFGIAVNDSRKNSQTGQWEDVPNFFDCNIFGARAESIADYLAKGTKVCLTGRLHQSTWETKEGSKRSKVEVIVDVITFMFTKQDKPVQYQTQADISDNVDMYDADIPF